MSFGLSRNMLLIMASVVWLLGCVEQQGLSSRTLSSSEIRNLERAAERGDADAQHSLGVLYAEGGSLRRDDAAAAEWFSAAAKQDHPRATYNLAYNYLNGTGVSQNHELALEYAKKASDLGVARADNLIGVMHESGLGIEQDYNAAFRHYTSAAQESDPYAQVNLANLYLNGNGVEKNFSRALHWTRQAAMQGHAPAQARLAYLHSGEVAGIEQDPEKTRDWAFRAAEQNNGFGHYILGALYKDGIGVDRDLVIAYMRYLLAEMAGFRDGDGRLRPIADELSVSQMLKAQSLKDQCVENNFKECEGTVQIADVKKSDSHRHSTGDEEESKLSVEVKNHLSCMAAYYSVVRKCSDIAEFRRLAEETNEDMEKMAESRSLATGTLGETNASVYVNTCIGEETEDVFGNARALEWAVTGLPGGGDSSSEEAPEKAFDWRAAGLAETVQRAIDRIYAAPNADAPMALKRTVARALGHAERARDLLMQGGRSESEVAGILGQYQSPGGEMLEGQDSEQQDTAHKVRACIGLL